MKEEAKIKEILKAEPTGTMPHVGAMQHMSSVPVTSAVQGVADGQPVHNQQDNMPVQPGLSGVAPYMMNQVPLICCPYLINMQCPMTFGANSADMNSANISMFANNPKYMGMNPFYESLGSSMPAFLGMNPGGMADNSAYLYSGMGMMPPANGRQFSPGSFGY